MAVFELNTVRKAFCEDFNRLPTELATVKKNAMARCKGKCAYRGTGKYSCSGCSRLNKSMCRAYHTVDAVDELVSRLVYEVIFGIISINDVAQGRWLDRRLRDPGHHYWMVRLVERIQHEGRSRMKLLEKLV